MSAAAPTIDQHPRPAASGAKRGPKDEAAGLAWAALIVLATGALYAINLGVPAHPDELHHVLAGQGLMETGEPRIAEGVYERGFAQTWLTARAFELLGVGLAAARAPSVLFVALLNGLLFWWLRREAGPLAAWLGAGLWALSPFAVDTARFARFYAPQTLSFVAGCLLVHGALLGRPGGAGRGLAAFAKRPGRWLAAALALPCLAFALHLQDTTVLGLAGLALWAAGAVALPWLVDRAVPAGLKLKALGALLALGLAALAAAWASGLLAEAWSLYRGAPIFNRHNADEFYYYHAWYALLYPTLWPLTGLLGLVALAWRPRAASLALVVFATGFVLNSFAATKSLRYIAYAQPFLFVPWAIGLAALAPALAEAWRRWGAGLRANAASFAPGLPAGGAAAVLATGAAAFLLLANPAWVRSATLIAGVAAPGETPKPDYALAYPVLAPWLREADVVVSTEELGALHFLGRYDVRFSPSKLEELKDGQRREFGLDFRTGRPVIAENASVALLIDCFTDGLVVGPRRHLGMEILVNDELWAMLDERAERLDLPRASQLYAYAWEHGPGFAPGEACEALPELAGPEGLRPPGK